MMEQLGEAMKAAKKAEERGDAMLKTEVEMLRELRAIHELLSKAIQPVGPLGPHALIVKAQVP